MHFAKSQIEETSKHLSASSVTAILNLQNSFTVLVKNTIEYNYVRFGGN